MDTLLSNAIDRHPPTITTKALVPEAIALLHQTAAPCVLVVEADSAKLVGLFSERDVVRLIGSGTDFTTQPVSTVISPQDLALKTSDLQAIEPVLLLFQRAQLRAVPIVDDQGQLVGLITSNGLLQAIGFGKALKQQGNQEEVRPWETSGDNHQQIERSLQKQLNRVLILQKITDAIRAQCDPQCIFETAVTQIGQVFGVCHCHLLIYTPAPTSQLTIAAEYSVSGSTTPIAQILLTKNPFVLQILVQEQAMATSNVYANPLLQSMESQCQQTGLKSILAIRTSYQDQPNGILVLYQCDRFRQWRTSEVQVLEAIASQVGIALAQIGLLEQEKRQREALDQQNVLLQQEIRERQVALRSLQKAEERLELFFTQSLDGFFFMMLDQPVHWNSMMNDADREKILDYVFAHQRITKVNDAILIQYGASREQFLNLTPSDLFAHDLDYGRQIWQQFFNAGKLHIETQEQKFDGTRIWIEGDYICLYDAEGRITGHFGVQRDITSRRHAEEELRRNEERWQLVIQASNDGIFDVDLTTGNGFYSRRFKEMLGYSDQEFANTRDQWADLLHPDDRDRVIATKASYLRREIPHLIQEYRLRCQDGTYKWILDRALAVWDEAGNPIRVLGTSTDISDRKQAEEALKRQQEFLRNVIDIPPNLIFAKDWNGRFVLANQATAGIYGTTVDNLIGKTDADFNPNLVEIERFLQDDREVISTGKPKLLDEIVTSATGEVRYFQTIKKPIEATDGQSVFALGIATDISDRKQSEAALAKRERYLAALVEIQRLLLASKPDQTNDQEILQQLGLASDASRVYRFENHWDAAGNRLMSQRAEWCAEAIAPQIDNPLLQNLSYQDFFPRWTKTLSRGDIINGIIADFPASERLVLEPQSILAILILPILVGGQFFGFIGFDNCITAHEWDSLEISLLGAAASALSLHEERKQAEAALAKLLVQTQKQSVALEKARDAAEAANRAKSEFLANMSHELRTPLNAILGFTQIMGHDTLLNPENHGYVNIINRSGQHLLALINDVLEMSKIEAGRLKLHATDFDLYYLLDTLYEMLYLKASAKHLQLTFERTSNLPQYITTDEGKLRQVLLNLLGNGIKFTQQGSVTLRVKAQRSQAEVVRNSHTNWNEVSIHPTSNMPPSPPITLCFEVEDTGTGIAPQDLQRLFSPFVQTPSGQQSSEGTGLGLTISQKFVQLMGGEITVASVVGQGSIFRFDVQAVPAPGALPPIPYPTQRVVSLVPNQPPSRVLIVEDHRENQLVLVNLLQLVGFDVQVASNGREGVTLWESWQPHVILMDMRMPVMDGYEATQQIRAKEQQRKGDGGKESLVITTTKIIAVTSSAFDEERLAILEAGCDDLISKPFRQEEIFAKLAQYLHVQYTYATKDERGAMESEYHDFGSSLLYPLRENLVLDRSSLSGMPDEWISKLHEAAILGKDRWLLELIGQLPSTHFNLAQVLKEWISNFRFDKIVELTEFVGYE